ncbi:TetR/AcrR family transcriptional regulator [Actinomadura sp. B10D3]|uniref:TetR/AcrR family transcriptional regulator n=1 Tax=Actinomadura sp. B10D3 TaxID=3153557 RepID=UPI00325EC2E4
MWTRPRGGRRPKLTREAIVEAAIRIADAEGLDAVSIRRIASELGVRAMSLYTHIDAKEDLLDLMYDEVAGEVLVDDRELPDDWRDAVLVLARRERDASIRHPWLLKIAGRSVRVGPNGLRHLEQSLAAIARLTDDPEKMLTIVKAVDYYMMGFIAFEQGIGQDRPSSPLEQAFVRKLVDSGELPHLKPFLETGLYSHSSFEQGLKWLLDGIEHEYGGK